MGKIVKGILLDVSYFNRNAQSIIRLFVKTAKGMQQFEDSGFKPYFFVEADNVPKAEESLKNAVFDEGIKIASIERAPKANCENALKLSFGSVQHLTAVRQTVTSLPGIAGKSEHDIPFAKRYLLDKALQPMNGVQLEVEGNQVKKASCFDVPKPEIMAGAFDIETLSPGRFSDPKKDPVLLVSLALADKTLVLSHGKKFVFKNSEVFEKEEDMLASLAEKINGENLDVIVTYNGDLFDFPYVMERANKLGMGFAVSADGSEPKTIKKGRDTAVKLHGLQHLDSYQMLRFLSRFAVVNLVKFDLESVVAVLFGREKEKLGAEEINSIWESGKGMERLAAYCSEDSAYTLKIGEMYMPLIVELCKIVKQTLFEVSRASASMLVEYLIIDKCRETKRLIANKPDDSTVQQRLMQPIKGGYVKEPDSGLHENLAVLDFSSLYPTIMISHNVSPDTVGCSHKQCKQSNVSPNKQWFCTKRKGLMAEIIKGLFERRMQIKQQAKKLGKKDEGHRILNARQQALKILLNSFYGYLGYSRSRFYSRECASAITAWARQYVQWVGKEAEKAGFELLYSDTDSAFLIIPDGKKQQDVLAFVEEINSKLPGVMNLELEGFFKRGIFVTKETGEGAKKKYALIDYKGNLKIVGFEYVRRDWAGIAKQTQRDVISAVLSEGNPEKALQIVRERIASLQTGKVGKQSLVVLTQLKRPLQKYDAIGPHVAAAKKAVARGRSIEVGSIIGYIVTRSGKSISDRAQLQEYVNEGNYDPDYYIEHQVIPAVIRIMRELGYSREDLIQGGKQKTLGSFG